MRSAAREPREDPGIVGGVDAGREHGAIGALLGRPVHAQAQQPACGIDPVQRACDVGEDVAQEIASDKAFGLRNVRGWWDVAGDLGAGVVGAVAYAAAYQRWVRDAGREPPSPLRD